MENVRNRMKVEFIKKDENEKILINKQSKPLLDFINLIQFMIAIQSSKVKF